MSKKANMPKTIVKEHHYDILLHPVITEKATMCSQDNKVVFKVAINATKSCVKEAVETLFKVKVKSVNTLRQVGKTKRFKGILGKRSDYKKAVVRLEAGQSIDFSAGI
jgi:large subunit ribosomal protein L23